MSVFQLAKPYSPAGDQPAAINALSQGVEAGIQHQTLLGATGTGKTYTIANVIANTDRPTLVIAHNKTLAAQLASEFREFFPHNAVRYFVSYYDYYQPEAYMPVTDTYIEKEAMINEEIDRLRHATTQALLSRKDVIVVASVSCIYGLGRPSEYAKVILSLSQGQAISRTDFLRDLIGLYFVRTNADLTPGTFRAVGNTVEIMPPHAREITRLTIVAGRILRIEIIDAVSRIILEKVSETVVFPAKHFVTPPDVVDAALTDMEAELATQLQYFAANNKIIEAERIKRRTKQDIALIRELGYTNGIENYSRHFDRRAEGEAPSTLLAYLKECSEDFLTVIDESHVTLPQLSAMYAGDRARKNTLVEHGFRLPSARDNRPLTYDEFTARVGQQIYVSATPGEQELRKSGDPLCDLHASYLLKGHKKVHDAPVESDTKKHPESCRVVEQIIRPTGLIDPEIVVEPITGSMSQVQHVIAEAEKTTKRDARTLITVLTKKMAEDLAEFLREKNIKAEYVHSDIKTAERIQILTKFRKGEFDVLVGVNLLREGLDLPEVELVAILDADKEGFLRSDTSLVQTIGRAARNQYGRVILYGDIITGSMERAIAETNRRREKQIAYNTKHGITPKTVTKEIKDITDQFVSTHKKTVHEMAVLDKKGVKNKRELKKLIIEKKRQMKDAAANLDFETAALLRDEIAVLEEV